MSISISRTLPVLTDASLYSAREHTPASPAANGENQTRAGGTPNLHLRKKTLNPSRSRPTCSYSLIEYKHSRNGRGPSRTTWDAVLLRFKVLLRAFMGTRRRKERSEEAITTSIITKDQGHPLEGLRRGKEQRVLEGQ